MNNKTTIFILALFISTISFVGGYILGTSNTLDKVSQQQIAITPSYKQADDTTSLQTATSTLAENQEFTIDTQKDNPLSALAIDSDTIIVSNTKSSPENNNQYNSQAFIRASSGLSINKDSSPTEMLEFLLFLATSTLDEDMDKFGPAMDLVYQTISEDPKKVDELISLFMEVDTDSRAPYYITSIIQGADLPNESLIFNELITRLTSIGDNNANYKLLNLVSSTASVLDNPEITEAIKNIALYSQDQDNNRLYALSLLKPFQLSREEKETLVSEFTIEFEQGASDEKSMMLENIIRFSDVQSRPKIASNYLAQQHEFETRVAVLSSLHSGTVQPTNTLKKQLLEIAENEQDPLQSHAKHALLYAFEISNEEYKRLKDDG